MIANTKVLDVNIQSAEFNPAASTAAQVAILLEQRIINREFIPGSRLVEEELVNEFKVSRSPVREALRLVANDGLVTIESRRGARVTQMNPRELRADGLPAQRYLQQRNLHQTS